MHPKKDIKPPSQDRSVKFADLGMSQELLDSISRMGFTQPTNIQAAAIPMLLTGVDLIAQAATGTGKTIAFAVPCVQSINPQEKTTQAIILCPTRELAVQVATEIKSLSKGINVLAIYGGQDIKIQLNALKRGAQIVVGTPGRIKDHMRRKTLKLDKVKYFVLDEADQMLDMGFAEEIEGIFEQTPRTRQTVMFSATLSKQLNILAKKYQKNAKLINLVGNKVQSNQIKQLCVHLKAANKDTSLEKIILDYKIFSGIIFCNTKRKVDELTKLLLKKNFSAASIHGDIKQRKRDQVMKGFREGSIELLVATDIAARGLDINNLEAVINYDLPRMDQDYIHRIGRTGRAGKTGYAFNFVTKSDSGLIQRIIKKHNLKMEACA